MHIIPVIDLLNGVVVHAKKGLRSSYRPINSELTLSKHPLDIVKAFIEIHPFKTMYIADLNRIQNINDENNMHEKVFEDICHTFPDLTIWLDAGFQHIPALDKLQQTNIKYVLGSENLSKIDQYQLLSDAFNKKYILSLDFLPQGYKGPMELLIDNQRWPKDVIMMSLKKVGANIGVDMETILKFTKYSQAYQLYAAGGVRNLQDLQLLEKSGVYGALIATALHNKQLTAKELNLF